MEVIEPEDVKHRRARPPPSSPRTSSIGATGRLRRARGRRASARPAAAVEPEDVLAEMEVIEPEDVEHRGARYPNRRGKGFGSKAQGPTRGG